nr:MAG TPA: regulatory protein [Caudoviricetes sp.]
MPFTAAELEEMRRADEEIERDFRWTQEELEASRRRDRAAVFAALPPEKQRNAAARKAYYEANRDKVAAAQKAYYEANRDKVAAAKKAYREANRDKLAAAQHWIHDARVERGYTQRDLARLCGASQPTIAMLECGMIALERCRCVQRLREILER